MYPIIETSKSLPAHTLYEDNQPPAQPPSMCLKYTAISFDAQISNMITEEEVLAKLKTIYDPEIPVNIVDLGLIYEVKPFENGVYIRMTLTTASCPAAALMPEEIRLVLEEIPEIKQVDIDIVYTPRWTRERMSEEARKILSF